MHLLKKELAKKSPNDHKVNSYLDKTFKDRRDYLKGIKNEKPKNYLKEHIMGYSRKEVVQG